MLPTYLWSISIQLVFESGFSNAFKQGQPWENVNQDEVKSFIISRVTAGYSPYGISVSTTSGNLKVYIGRSGEGFGYAVSGIGSYINENAYAEVYSNNFANYPEWQGNNATVESIGEAIAGTVSHEAGHLINLYHAYMFNSFDPIIPGALNSNYQPQEPEYLPSSCTIDPDRYKHLMATRNYITLEQRATVNRFFSQNSDLILKFAKNVGYNVSRNITWGINNKKFYQKQNILVYSGKTLIIASGDYTHNLNNKYIRCEGDGKIDKRGVVEDYEHYAI